MYDRGCRCIACRAGKSAQAAVYITAHREEVRGRRAAYYAAHREEAKAYNSAWKALNQEWIAAYDESRREVRSAYGKGYKATHLEQEATHSRNRRARIRGNGGTHTTADIAAQRTRQNGKCFWCGGTVGKHYHVDHVMPIILGGSNSPENLVIACAFCNDSKGAKHPMDFAGMML